MRPWLNVSDSKSNTDQLNQNKFCLPQNGCIVSDYEPCTPIFMESLVNGGLLKAIVTKESHSSSPPGQTVENMAHWLFERKPPDLCSNFKMYAPLKNAGF